MQAEAEDLRRRGKTIAFVPTMGYLHEGHLSLMRKGKARADILVLSIFVNPTQFAPHEDFDAYPRDLERDLNLARETGVDIVFAPNREELYPQGFETSVRLEQLPNHLCGISRPVFFTGVTTVVAKLFNIVRPHIAVFGEKDYQQLTIIRHMARDLNMDTRIIAGPTVREPDGLAMSSRNAYLKPEERKSARTLYGVLLQAKAQVENGVQDASEIIRQAKDTIATRPDTRIDYIALVDPSTLADVTTVDRPVRMALAVFVGNTRLIDNMALHP